MACPFASLHGHNSWDKVLEAEQQCEGWTMAVVRLALHAALAGVALGLPSAPAPWSAEAHSLRGWRDP